MNAPVSPLNIQITVYLELRNRLAKIYDLENDDEALLGSLEGATDLNEQIAVVLRESKAAEAMADGLDSLIDAMKARKVRLSTKADNLRAAALWALRETGQTKLATDDMTVSVMPGKPKTQVDLSKLPDEFKKTRSESIANLELIKCRIDQGDVPPGVEIIAPVPFLMVRVK